MSDYKKDRRILIRREVETSGARPEREEVDWVALGCLLIGMMMSLVEDRQVFRPEVRSFLMIGLLGSFTTFSTLGYETVELLRDNEFRFAFLSIAANVVLGIGAVFLGRIAVAAVT